MWMDGKHSTFLHPPAVRVGDEMQPEVRARSAYVDAGKSRRAFSRVGSSAMVLPVVPEEVTC